MEIYDCIGNRKAMEDGKSVPIGSHVGHSKPPAPIGSQTQPSYPIRDKNRINSMGKKGCLCWSMKGHGREVVKVWREGNRGVRGS